jgi:hypothetical protein
MSGYAFKNGAVSVMFEIQLYDATKTATNGGLTGLSNTSAGLIIGTRCDVESAVTAYTQAGGTIQTIATIGTYAAPSAGNIRFAQIDATNAPGLYQVQILNSRMSVANAKFITITVPAVAGLNLLEMPPLVIPLTDFDPYSRQWNQQAQMAENYSTSGTQGSLEQCVNDIHQFLMNSNLTSTAWTIYKQAGTSQTAFGCTTNNASNPTQVLRTS